MTLVQMWRGREVHYTSEIGLAASQKWVLSKKIINKVHYNMECIGLHSWS
jgi:hypothetical protein